MSAELKKKAARDLNGNGAAEEAENRVRFEDAEENVFSDADLKSGQETKTGEIPRPCENQEEYGKKEAKAEESQSVSPNKEGDYKADERSAHTEESFAASSAKERIRTLKKLLDSPKYVSGGEDLIPFAWRYPVAEGKPKAAYKKPNRAFAQRGLPAKREE